MCDYKNLAKALRRCASTEATCYDCPHNCQADCLGAIITNAADAIEELCKCLDGVSADNDSLCAQIEEMSVQRRESRRISVEEQLPEDKEHKRMKKVYLAGKITGNPNYKEEFSAAERLYAKKGYAVLNPATLPEGMESADYMRICFAMIDCADFVVFLPSWLDSDGAKIEYYYCRYIGKACRTDDWEEKNEETKN